MKTLFLGLLLLTTGIQASAGTYYHINNKIRCGLHTEDYSKGKIVVTYVNTPYVEGCEQNSSFILTYQKSTDLWVDKDGCKIKFLPDSNLIMEGGGTLEKYINVSY